MVTGAITVRPVSDLRLFFGTPLEALAAAKRAQQQQDVNKIIAYRGDPAKRTSLEFETEFCDGDIVFLPFSKDLSSTTQFELFCRLRKELWSLLLTTDNYKIRLKQLKNLCVTEYTTFPAEIYVDIKQFGNSSWYEDLSLPDPFRTIYVFSCEVTTFANPSTKKEVRIVFPLMDERYIENNVWVHTWGRYHKLEPNMRLIDAKFALEHLQIFDFKKRAALRRKFKSMINDI